MTVDLNGKVFLGVVEDNNDPDRQNKCRVRVINIFDGIPSEDIPWATPWKDANGLSSTLPDRGKVVSVEFENGDIYSPMYRYSEHYNINLESKLKDLSDDDYLSMKSILFDHKTQVYVNESEGLKLDHKFNLMNITKSDIILGLKDNGGSVNIGTATANQQAILGNNFLDWFDGLVSHLLGEKGGPYFGNLYAPIVPNPGLIAHLTKYKAMKEPKFLSHNVNFNDNGYVDKLDRINLTEIGDDWKSTVEDNTLKSSEVSDYTPTNRLKSDTPDGIITPDEENGEDITPFEMPSDTSTHDDVLTLIKVMNDKNYIIYSEPFKMNIVGVRYNYPGSPYSNAFNDKLFVFYKDDKGDWNIHNYQISTMPGAQIKISKSKYNSRLKGKGADPSLIGKTISLKEYARLLGRKGLGILKEAQYVDMYTLGSFLGAPALKTIGNARQLAWRDANWGSNKITYSFEDTPGNFGMHLHKGYPGGARVNNWSEGCQVFKSKTGLDSFANLMRKHKNKHKNIFTYTLILSTDYDKFS